MCRLRPSNPTLCEALARPRLRRTRTHSGDYSTIGCHRNCQNLLPLHKTGSEKMSLFVHSLRWQILPRAPPANQQDQYQGHHSFDAIYFPGWPKMSSQLRQLQIMSRSATHQQVYVLLLADSTSGGERLQEHFAFFWVEIMITNTEQIHKSRTLPARTFLSYVVWVRHGGTLWIGIGDPALLIQKWGLRSIHFEPSQKVHLRRF